MLWGFLEVSACKYNSVLFKKYCLFSFSGENKTCCKSHLSCARGCYAESRCSQPNKTSGSKSCIPDPTDAWHKVSNVCVEWGVRFCSSVACKCTVTCCMEVDVSSLLQNSSLLWCFGTCYCPSLIILV